VIVEIDEALKNLLMQEIDIQGNEVDINFEQPKRDWSARLSKPTINLFLFDVRENLRLRGAEQYTTIRRADGTSEVRRNLVRMDLRYLMTAWVKEAEDEHLLLSSALISMLRFPFLPQDLLPDSFKEQPAPISIEVATFPPENGPTDKFTEIWGVLDNEMRPGVQVTVTVAVDPYRPMVFKQVRTREVRYVQQSEIAPDTSNGNQAVSKTYWTLGGTIQSTKHALSTISAVLVEKQLKVELDEDGRFTLPSLNEGEYHLDILVNNKVLKRQPILVPSDEYEIVV